MQTEIIGDSRFGIIVYKTNLKTNISLALECELSMSTHDYFKWHPATVGYFQKPDPDYRKCVDCKIDKQHLGKMPIELESIYKESSSVISSCVSDYTKRQNIHPMKYMEAINFVRYGVGEHFAPHNDHGHTYVSTVSTVTYLNDNYEGGEIQFSKLGITLKPEAGDVLIFPSTFIYTHASLPVTSGVKYSAVTMFDYTDKWHKFHAEKDPLEIVQQNRKSDTPDMLCGNFPIKDNY